MIVGMADISLVPLGETTSVLENAIHGSMMEHDQLANNIANVNTPNFRSSNVDFKAALQQSLGVPADPSELAMSTNSARQFAIGDPVAPAPFDPQAVVDTSTQMRVDGSNVDIDQASAQLSANTGYQETMSQLLEEQYKFMREAITEQF
jgi:flagellar basal-body rod protein FlgB